MTTDNLLYTQADMMLPLLYQVSWVIQQATESKHLFSGSDKPATWLVNLYFLALLFFRNEA